MTTIGVGVEFAAALLAVDLAWTGVSGDVDQTLDDVQRRLISGDITRPEATS